ncbi:MAG: branched-chain amino acid ABC transporter permease [Rhodocyclaceae bacterium]|nr:branched-chain amino acid ABC transporter permease [Rhodocyclaceae bacterium]
MMYFVFLQAPFTGGEDGLQGVPRGKLLGFIDLADDLNLYYFVLSIFVFGFWLIHRTIHSPFGQVLKAIRENETRAISLGYDVAKYKLLAFVLSAGLAGAGRRHQDAGVPLRHLDRRTLAHLGRGGADDAARRHGHSVRPGRGCGHHRDTAERVGRQGRLARHRHHGCDLRDLRAGFPPRHRR